ncbi:MAG: ABC transporter ATP-binding protein [Eubacteriales bacterium]|nr:ABC transporter ATP-binding protein [Eubacteriales bacterium]
MIVLKDLTKEFGKESNKVVALDNVSCELPQGKFISIVGKSGCGKSTLLNLIGGLEKPTSGSVIIDGVDLYAKKESELAYYRNKTIGYVFQDFYLEPELSVIDNVSVPLIIAGKKAQEISRLAQERISALGLESKTNEPTKNLSGGQKQRVAIARALVADASIILADEPTGNLDSDNSSEVVAILRRLADEGKTVIMVTHNLEEARQADITVEMKDGKIVEIKD